MATFCTGFTDSKTEMEERPLTLVRDGQRQRGRVGLSKGYKEEEREKERDRTERFRAHFAKSTRILHNVAASMHLDLFPGSFQMSLNQRLARSRWRRP